MQLDDQAYIYIFHICCVGKVNRLDSSTVKVLKAGYLKLRFKLFTFDRKNLNAIRVQ